MDAWTKALQPVSAPDFIDKAFKESPEGVSFRQWQPLDGMLDSMGRQLQGEDVLNHGGSSQGSQTAMDSPHRRMLSGGKQTQATHGSVVSQSELGLLAPQLYRSLLPVQRSQDKVKPTMAVIIQDLPMTCKMSIVRCRIHRALVILETVQLLSVGPAFESITLRRACSDAGASAGRGNRQRTDTVRALNKLAQQRYR